MNKTHADSSRFHFKDKILLLRYFKLGRIPPALSAAQLLVESGLPVLVVEYGVDEPSTLTTVDQLDRVRRSGLWMKKLPHGLRAAALFVQTFFFLSWKILREGKPRLMVGHGLQDQTLIYALSLLFGLRYTLNIYEIYQKKDGDLSRINRLFFALEGRCLRRAEWLLFPAQERLELYRERYQLKNPCYAVFNSVRLRRAQPGTPLTERLRLPAEALTLLYIGGVDDLNCVSEGVRAIAHVPQVHFVLAGWITEEYRAQLEAIALQGGYRQRLHLVGEVRTSKWDWIDNADLGFCLYRPTVLRNHFPATSSNKLMEYIAAGVPMVAGVASDFKSVVDKYQLGVSVSRPEPTQIAQALTRLAESASLRAQMRQNCLALHQKQLNFEFQFAPVLKRYQECFPQIQLAPEKLRKLS